MRDAEKQFSSLSMFDIRYEESVVNEPETIVLAPTDERSTCLIEGKRSNTCKTFAAVRNDPLELCCLVGGRMSTCSLFSIERLRDGTSVNMPAEHRPPGVQPALFARVAADRNVSVQEAVHLFLREALVGCNPSASYAFALTIVITLESRSSLDLIFTSTSQKCSGVLLLPRTNVSYPRMSAQRCGPNVIVPERVRLRTTVVSHYNSFVSTRSIGIFKIRDAEKPNSCCLLLTQSLTWHS
jgi:hypothetical protein